MHVNIQVLSNEGDTLITLSLSLTGGKMERQTLVMASRWSNVGFQSSSHGSVVSCESVTGFDRYFKQNFRKHTKIYAKLSTNSSD